MISNSELVHLIHEGIPWEDQLALVEQRIRSQWILRRRSVREQESHGDLVICWVRSIRDRSIRNQLKSHRRSVVDDSSEVDRSSRELRETEERQERSIGAELDANLLLGFAGDSAVELLQDLCCESGAGDSTDGLGAIIGKVVLVVIGKSLDLEESIGGQKIAGWDGFVVDLGHVDVIEDFSESVREIRGHGLSNLLVYAFLKVS